MIGANPRKDASGKAVKRVLPVGSFPGNGPVVDPAFGREAVLRATSRSCCRVQPCPNEQNSALRGHASIVQ